MDAQLRETNTPQYRLHLDADRDGRVDDDPGDLATWRSGPRGRGAVVLRNNDSDDTNRQRDSADVRVDGGNDRTETAPIVIRRRGPAPPGSWVGYLELSADDARRARVFGRCAAGAAEILGPPAARRYGLPSLAFTEREYAMEAARHAGAGFADGLMWSRPFCTPGTRTSPTSQTRSRPGW